ncbi:MAG: HD domain-containing phosphohydrolase [Halanaerobium sp.]|nr:HD domain-containing phosphohydrolase [Halanaerobium sp.]
MFGNYNKGGEFGELNVSKERVYRLIRNNDLLEGFFQLDLSGMAIVDMHGNIIYVNNAWGNALGYQRDELLDKSIFEITYGDDLPKTMRMMEKVKNGKLNQARYRKRYICQNGSTIWVTVNYSVYFDENNVPLFYYAIMTDLTEVEEMQSEVSYRLRGEKIISGISQQLLLGKSSDLKYVLSEIGEHVGAERAYIYKLDSALDGQESLQKLCGLKIDSSIEIPEYLPSEFVSILKQRLSKSKIIKVEDVHGEQDDIIRKFLNNHSIKSILFFPVFSKEGSITGLMGFDKIRGKEHWAEGDIHLLKILSEMISVYWSYQRENEYLDETMNSLVHALTIVTGIRDPYTTQHQKRVSEIALEIAGKLGLGQQKMKKLKIASLLHDIGKIRVPTELLTKPGKLSGAEFELIKEHAREGYEILTMAGFDNEITEIVYQHHERLDGSGYPRKLKGNEIKLEAKILGVADVVEAMDSHRPYRPALGVERALDEIFRYKGSLYSPKVVEACLEIYNNKASL